MPTLNRQEFALRSMRYWSEIGVNLIVVDGTSQKIADEKLVAYPASIKYISNTSSWTNRMKLGVQFCETPYSALICDDEFYIPSSLIEITNLLDENPDFSSSIGHIIRFVKTKKDIFYKREYSDFHGAHILLDSPIKRVEQHLSSYKLTALYGVCRTEIFKKNIEVANICSRLPNPGSFELGFAIANAYQGKSQIIPSISWMRSSENPPSWNTNAQSIPEWWIEGKHSNEFVEIAREVDNVLSKTGDAFDSNVRDSILFRGFENYVKNSSQKRVSYSRKISSGINHFFSKFLDYEDAWALKISLKRFLGTFFKIDNNWQTLDEVLSIVKSEGLSCSPEDIRLVSKFIKGF